MSENNSIEQGNEATTQATVERTVSEIQAEAAAKSTALVGGYMDLLDQLREQRELSPGEYRDDLPPDTRVNLLQKRKMEEASERREKTVSEYAALVEETHGELAARRERLEQTLFSVPSDEVLVRTALESDAELQALATTALQAGSASVGLARAVLNIAVQRGAGDILAAIFDAYPELESSYREWQALPPKEVMERQADPASLDAVVPKPDPERLKVRPRISN